MWLFMGMAMDCPMVPPRIIGGLFHELGGANMDAWTGLLVTAFASCAGDQLLSGDGTLHSLGVGPGTELMR